MARRLSTIFIVGLLHWWFDFSLDGLVLQKIGVCWPNVSWVICVKEKSSFIVYIYLYASVHISSHEWTFGHISIHERVSVHINFTCHCKACHMTYNFTCHCLPALLNVTMIYRRKQKGAFAYSYMVSFGIILCRSNIGGIAGSAFADH